MAQKYTRRSTPAWLLAGWLTLVAVPSASAQVTYNAGTNGAPNGGQINISGATLFVDFFNTPSSTNDFINANGNMIPRPGPCNDMIAGAGFYDSDCDGFQDSIDQLAPTFVCPTWSGYWLFQYRSVGSVEGFGEFVDFQTVGVLPRAIPSERGIINGRRFANLGVVQNIGCSVNDCDTDGSISNDSGTPVCPESVDAASTDVRTSWVVRAGSNTNGRWDRKPTENGYGFGLRPSTTGFLSQLESLTRTPVGGGAPVSLNTDTTNPNSKTVYDTLIAWSPVAPIANPGTGIVNINYTQLQHLMVSGRMPSGENLVGQCRDVGSGTRNAWANSLGIDPAWCNGDNVGTRINDALFAQVGPACQPTHCGGSGISESAVQNWRLAIGFTGLTGASRAASDAQAGLYEVLNVCKDIDGDGNGQPDSDCTPSSCFPAFGGGCQGPPNFDASLVQDDAAAGNNGFVRPTISTVLDNADPRCGYQIGGEQTLSTVGDPESGRNGNVHPAMTNLNARNYIRNITDSIQSFDGNPNSNANFNMPGELLATSFFLTAGVDGLPVNNNPTHLGAHAATFNQSVQDYARCFNGLQIGQDTPGFGATTVAGRVPQRRASGTPSGFSVTYSDGSSNGRYTDAAGGFTITSSTRLNHRNRVSGDFNYDMKRDWNDIDLLVKALCQPRRFQADEVAAPPAVPAGAMPLPPGQTYNGGISGPNGGNYVIPEILGDFNGDGNFNTEDGRYFADGLAMNPLTGVLNRREGFKRLDMAWNQWRPIVPATSPSGLPAATVCTSTVPCWHPTLPSYLPAWPSACVWGAAAADIAGNPVSIGFAPTGHDGHVDGKDIAYVYANFGNFTNLRYDAAIIDLSADMNGDLAVNQLDVDVIVHEILGTEYGDANFDGRVDSNDAVIVMGNMTNPCAGGCRWEQGDFNGDGLVTTQDLDIVNANVGFRSRYFCDIDGDCLRTPADAMIFANVLLGNDLTPSHVAKSDQDGSGTADGRDVALFVQCYVHP